MDVLGTDEAAVRAGLRQLADARHLVLDEADEVVTAHPFAAVPLGFSVMGAATLWRLASRWHEGRLDRGYQRRDPATAAAYFREVGLRHPFWGTT